MLRGRESGRRGSGLLFEEGIGVESLEGRGRSGVRQAQRRIWEGLIHDGNFIDAAVMGNRES